MKTDSGAGEVVQPRRVMPDWCCPTCGCISKIPERPALGTKVRNAVHGDGEIFSYEQCDEISCGVDFGKNGQWCIALRDLEILSHNAKAQATTPEPTNNDYGNKQ